MNRLVYGIGLASGHWERPLPAGPLDCATSLFCEGELAAAYSAFAASQTNRTAAYLTAYAGVIEQLHRRGPFLPMRYACVLPGEASIRELLQLRRRELLDMLDAVAACDEFGLRSLPDDSAAHAGEFSSQGARSDLRASGGAGCRYLAERYECYVQGDARRRRAAAIAEQIRETFEGLYVRCERDSAAAPLVSLNFLVRRQDQNRFRRTFAELRQRLPGKLLLTGPWPPYHFVAMKRSGAAS